MSEKCGFDLGLIKTLNSMYKIKKWSQNELRDHFIKVLDKIAKEKAITDPELAANEIYNALHRSIVNLNSTFFNPKNILNIITGIKLGYVSTNNFEVSAERASIREAEEVQLRRNITSEFLDNAYGMVSEARDKAIQKANLNLFDALFINRGSIEGNIGLVKTNLDRNRNIRNYLEQLLRKIVEYLDSILDKRTLSLEVKDALKNPKLYNGNKNTGILTILKPYIKNNLSRDNFISSSNPLDNSLDGLRSLYHLAYSNDSKSDKAKLHLDAYNAAVMLLNFDSYLDVILGDTIEIKDVGIKTGSDDKYVIGKKTAKLATSWSNLDDIDVAKLADFVTKLAINTTPLYYYGTSSSTDRFLTFSDFLYIIAKIKDLAFNSKAITKTIGSINSYGRFQEPSYWNNLSELTRNTILSIYNSTKKPVKLSTIINTIRRNPRRYAGVIFDLLSNSDFYKEMEFGKDIFEDYDKNIIYSLNKGIFSPNENSLYKLGGVDGNADYYSFITLVIDTIFPVKYLQYYRDPDGILLVRTFVSLNINNIRRNIETNIDSSNNDRAITNFSEFKENLLLNTLSGGKILYTIPGTNITIETTGFKDIIIKDNGKYINDYSKYFKNEYVTSFLDLKLRLGITDNIDLLNALGERMFGNSNAMKTLLEFASDIILNQVYIHQHIKPSDTAETIKKIITEQFGNRIRYNESTNMVSVISSDFIPTLRDIAIAKANVFGITTSTLTKDGEGNSLSLLTTSRLLGSHWSQFELQEKNADSATQDCLILTVPGLYKGMHTSKEYYDEFDGAKPFTDMCVSEFTQSNFLMDYIGGIIPKLDVNGAIDTNAIVGNGVVAFIPSVNSDKNTIGRMIIDLNAELILPDETIKAIKDFNHSELRWLISTLFGNIYTNMYELIVRDYDILVKHIQENFNILCPDLKTDYLTDFKNFNGWWYKNQELLLQYGESPVDFIKYMVLDYNKTHRLHPLRLIDQTHFKVAKLNLSIDGLFVTIKNALACNQVLIGQIARFNPDYLKDRIDISIYPDEQSFWKTLHKELLKSLIDSKFQINTTNNDQSEVQYLRKNKNWINTSGDVILAKVKYQGKSYDITSSRDLSRLKLTIVDGVDRKISDSALIDEFDSVELHPDIETWNYLDYLFTLEFMDCTVGSFINHPEKSKDPSELEIYVLAKIQGIDPKPELHKRLLAREAAHFQALHKRNVSFTAAMHEFELNLLNGIPEEYNLAVIEDITDFLATINGVINKIKPFDGATYVNPFVVLLENYSLGGSSAGISKKLFVHFKDEKTGTGGIIKTAGFGLTNDWIRNSTFLQLMMLKMTDHVWLLETKEGEPEIQALVNITKDYLGNTIIYENQYFELNGEIYKIERIESLGNNQYRRVVRRVLKDNLGNPLVNSFSSDELFIDNKGNIYNNNECNNDFVRANSDIINTNYKLWQLFGGYRSMSENGQYLEYSNSSVENVVKAMNRTACIDRLTGNIITRNGATKIETQDDLWQPLKHVDVHYLATAGAVKQGGANINSKNKYTNNEAYDTYRIKMYQAGIQLDKEHHADDTELSLMTLVISACAAKGYTYEAASLLYDALRKSTEIGIKEHLAGVKKYIESKDPSGVQEAMYKAIINSLGTSKQNGSNFAYLVASDLIRQAKEGKAIKFSETSLPLSDKTVYNKIFSVVSSYLTNSGIKQKIPGILSVLTPSFNIFKIYAGRKYESFTNPQLELEELQKELAPVFDMSYQWTLGQEDFAGLQLVYVNPGELISLTDGQPVAMRNPHDGRVLIDILLMKDKFDQKAWRNTRNSEPLDYDFKSFDEWMRFALLHEAMHNVYLIKEGESKFDYETRVNKLALKRLQNHISNLELGREYFITYNVMTEVADADGNLVLISVPTEPESKLIRTPLEYQKLKQDILDGKVYRVVENVTVGRDLAAYNIRFSATDGSRFQLWDLDSAVELFEANEQGDTERVKLLRRELLKDLMNLSHSAPDILALYDELLKSRETFSPTLKKVSNQYNWARTAVNSYEVSTAGDNRFSALLATFKPGTIIEGIDVGGRTIEDVYLKVIKKSGKGLPPATDSILYNPSLTSNIDRENFSYEKGYLPLWTLWANLNPLLIEELRDSVEGKVLTDLFANTRVSLARALADILNGSLLIEELTNVSWYDYYAQWVNIYLGTGNGSEIDISGIKTRITAENFEEIEKYVRQLVQNTTRVRIGGRLYTINKDTVKALAYELIMPKTFASKFGLNKFADLNKIANDPDYFVEQYRLNQAIDLNGGDYSLALLNSNGNHTYLISKDQVSSINPSFHKVDYLNLGIMDVDSKKVRLDSKGNIIYEVSDDFELYVDDNGHEIIATDNIDFYLNNISFDSLRFSPYLLNRLTIFELVLDGISKSTDKTAERFYKFIGFNKKRRNFLQVYDNNVDYNKIPEPTELDYEDTNIIKSLREKHTSFVKSLDVVAARIPSQSMQSFMPMRVVAFDNPDINTAHVSTMQILLQGSDY